VRQNAARPGANELQRILFGNEKHGRALQLGALQLGKKIESVSVRIREHNIRKQIDRLALQLFAQRGGPDDFNAGMRARQSFEAGAHDG
jgi:hypothetical protein